MRINKKTQYGLLFTLYLARVGRGTSQGAAGELAISSSFLDQVARRLRIGRVIRSIRGPGGGYELVGDPTVSDVFVALGASSLFTKKEYQSYLSGTVEDKALAGFVKRLDEQVKAPLRAKIRALDSGRPAPWVGL